MSGADIKLAGPIKNDERDLEKLGQIMRRTGLENLDHPSLCAVIVQTFHERPNELRKAKGRKVYMQAVEAIRGTAWFDILFPTKNAKLELELKQFRQTERAKYPSCFGEDDPDDAA